MCQLKYLSTWSADLIFICQSFRGTTPSWWCIERFHQSVSDINVRCQLILHLFDPPFLKIKISFHNSNLSYHIVGIWSYSAAPNPTLLFSHRCQSHSFFCVKSALKKQKVNHIIKDLLKYSTNYFAHAQNIFTWNCTSHIGVSKEWKTLISIS